MKTLKILGVLTTLTLAIHTLVARALDSGAKSGRLMPNGDVVQNDFQTLPIEQVLKDHRVKEVQTDRLTSSLAPVVVRQNGPGGPRPRRPVISGAEQIWK